ncbi:hypothetical protein FDP41_004777 [Naegleria fowleri]|uniref:Complex 1 LYR protein domain-containing protein n=1 Tax=Naegleria fowleri TaxID=5763 RepID=A0A6A5BMJ7_NAEFO|nr:uncharacterized protein FDP41_004777 [Naegleria fowleri]KAF0976102.1 hypothetical protein FDP41_004777 [Naegleria fowleri]CAG4710358.1 unnamed protein product [Naegleria fowleri]
MQNKESLKLFMRVLRSVRKLPVDAQGYYRNYAYQQFQNHKAENEERTQQILERAKQDIEWIERKYNIHSASNKFN